MRYAKRFQVGYQFVRRGGRDASGLADSGDIQQGALIQVLYDLLGVGGPVHDLPVRAV